MTDAEDQTKKDEKELSRLENRKAWKSMADESGKLLLTGIVLTTCLETATLFGIQAQMLCAQLKHEVLYISPLFLVMTLGVVCLASVTRGGETERSAERWVVSPILRFMLHVFGVAFGAIPVVFVASKINGEPMQGSVAGFSMFVAGLACLLALMGSEMVRRPNLKLGKLAPALLLFGLLFSGVTFYLLCQVTVTPEELTKDMARRVVEVLAAL